MRPLIIGLDVDAMEWAPLGPPGLFSKLLSRDPDTGARTALQRLSPDQGYQAPTVAHFHSTYEEILGISGLFSFDSRTWIVPGSYVFHPIRTVHGFNSKVIEDSLFLSRVGQDLDVNHVHDPMADDLYVVEGEEPARKPAAYGDAAASIGWSAGELLGQPVSICRLSIDPETGEGSALVRLPAGWKSDAQQRPDYLELFVLDGGLVHDETPPPAGRAYFCFPPQSPICTLRTERTTELYVNFGGTAS